MNGVSPALQNELPLMLVRGIHSHSWGYESTGHAHEYPTARALRIRKVDTANRGHLTDPLPITPGN